MIQYPIGATKDQAEQDGAFRLCQLRSLAKVHSDAWFLRFKVIGGIHRYNGYVCMYVLFIHASVSHMGRLAAGRCRWLGMATNIFIYIQDIEPVDF